jgi:3,4-dihydroxy 2-butanone 4-phosphate synthase/GTP cyclohydrolase II
MNDDGSMARMPDLERFAKKHGLLILTIADLIQYRLQTERLVVRVAETTMRLDVTGTEWSAVVFDILGESRQFLALVKGELDPNEPVLTRVHAGGIVSDVFSSTPSDGGANLRQSMRMIEAAGRGVILYIPSKDDLAFELSRRKKPNGAEPPARPASPGAANAPLREFGLGAQVLAALGAQELRLISNNQAKIAGIHGFGLKVVERIPILPE